MQALPNILTSARLVLALFMFVALAAASGGIPFLGGELTAETQFALLRWGVVALGVGGITDVV
jgi:phosphatidylglycerophosphate synthase